MFKKLQNTHSRTAKSNPHIAASKQAVVANTAGQINLQKSYYYTSHYNILPSQAADGVPDATVGVCGCDASLQTDFSSSFTLLSETNSQ